MALAARPAQPLTALERAGRELPAARDLKALSAALRCTAQAALKNRC